jgi:tRNA 2-selenouridine synthase
MKFVSVEESLVLRTQIPLVDVRSPLEFAEGNIPSAVNIPLLNNDERVRVGTLYKKEGQSAAIQEGFRLVGPRLSEIVSLACHVATHGELIVHCWRGGMRSTNFAQFIEMARLQAWIVKGGYKAYRQMALETFKKPWSFILLTGYTGSGKTDILHALKKAGEQVIDLEGLACHKGSAFGGLWQPPQPTTEQFQNNLFEELNRLDLSRSIWIEDESIALGKIFMPADFWQCMSKSPMVQVSVPQSVRIQRLVHEYGEADRKEFLSMMTKITTKLGGQHFNAARERLLAGDMSSVMEILLTYYDKAYTNSIQKRSDRLRHTIEWDAQDVDSFVTRLLRHLNH